MNRFVPHLVALALLGASFSAAPAIAGNYAEQKVVYHNSGAPKDDPDYFRRMLGNVGNHIAAVGETNVEFVVVAHGGGLDMLQQATDDPDLAGRIDALNAKGVRFVVCANTLKSRHIRIADLYGADEGDIVPSGVAEIAHLEQQGFVYLHP
jgi:intracellular sulfur oxidation DsrE/DsrF family protein